MQSKRILGIIYGGRSSEHEVSIRTAFSILQAIDYDRWLALPLYIDVDGSWSEGELLTSPPKQLDQIRLDVDHPPDLFKLKEKVDILFPVVHGPYGEDGTLQGLLEMIDVPYVGSGVMASSMGMDKVMMKRIFSFHHLPQVDYLAFSRREIDHNLEAVCATCEAQLGYPVFVKPANLGSSVGISKAKCLVQLRQALLDAASFDQKVIVEAFADGREVEIGVLGNHPGNIVTSVVGEVVSHAEFYDYASKYRDGGAELFIPANIPDRVASEMAQVATEAFLALECSGLARVDFFWCEKEDRLYLNEINTMPGFTQYSMYPMLFKAAGWTYQDLIERLIELGMERYTEKKRNKVMVAKLD
jgi:D-alanine-D-alanine ligase